jgi:hypothetical protein
VLSFATVQNDRKPCGRFFFSRELRDQLGWKPLEVEPIRYVLTEEQYLRSLSSDPALAATAEKLAVAFRLPIVFVYQDRLCSWTDPPCVSNAPPEPVTSPVEVKADRSGVRSRVVEPPAMPTIKIEDVATWVWRRNGALPK